MSETLPVNQRYDYVFDGNSQSLDQMYVSNAARGGAQYDIVHMNAEFASQASDHDALVASFDMTADVSTTPTGALAFDSRARWRWPARRSRPSIPAATACSSPPMRACRWSTCRTRRRRR